MTPTLLHHWCLTMDNSSWSLYFDRTHDGCSLLSFMFPPSLSPSLFPSFPPSLVLTSLLFYHRPMYWIHIHRHIKITLIAVLCIIKSGNTISLKHQMKIHRHSQKPLQVSAWPPGTQCTGILSKTTSSLSRMAKENYVLILDTMALCELCLLIYYKAKQKYVLSLAS